jgi:predicted secreted protein
MEMSLFGRRAVFLVSLAWAAACGSSGSTVANGQVTVHEQANGTTVAVPFGQTLVVDLRNPGDGGYGSWVLAAAPTSTVLRLTQASHEPPSAGAMPGDFGRDVFVLDAVGVGTTQLGATATRAFSGETITYTLDVVVR